MILYNAIQHVIQYGIHHRLFEVTDQVYVRNKILQDLKIKEFEEPSEIAFIDENPSTIIKPLLDYAVEEGIIPIDTTKQRDIFEAKIMDHLIPRPSTVIQTFFNRYNTSPKDATSWYYTFSKKSNYIKTSRTSKNIIWKTPTPYGTLDMTINLSKPEKDPRDIMNAKNKISISYPKCFLCKENEGYYGHINNPGRSNHRIIPLTLAKEQFYLQYSPYVYYNEHCIVLHEDHIPMNVTQKTFERLFDFVDQFPHYFLGSNAGLPIVGGSILSHEHYQGGNYHFPIEDAFVVETFHVDSLTIEQLQWPLSVIRLSSTNRYVVEDAAHTLFQVWRNYTDEAANIIAYTDEPHNAITPIARKNNDTYILDITLRNNRTSDEYPLGIFHPHPEHHHIKKENIGLIEVMGLAVLPARLEDELDCIIHNFDNDTLPEHCKIHEPWFQTLKSNYNNNDIKEFVYEQVGLKFMKVIENAGVFSQDNNNQERFRSFIKEYINVLS